ncbi:MAG: response regulator transcription factor [Actinomycetota bacterium]
MTTPTVPTHGGRPPPTGQAVVSIVLVDDHAIVRQGIRSILERHPQMCVVGEAATSDEAMAVVSYARPRIVLLDLKLSPSSDTEGLELCQKLTSTYPDTAVLVLTTFMDDQLVVRAIRSGARGYVVKDVDTRELVRAIQAISQGESAFDSRSAAAMVRSLNARSPVESKQLTEREREVLSLLARGLSNRDIGKRLYISETTAKFHVGNILRKLNVSRRAEAVYAASKTGLI